MNENYRFYEIDLLRFIAALSVVFFHYTFRGYAADDMSVLSFPYMGEISRYGYFGFHLFFMISGYVILLSAFKKTSSEFIIARMVRLYPAYWFSVTLTFFTILIIGGSRYNADWPQYLVNLTMIHGYIGVHSIDGVYWTLMLELKFYFLIFLLILFNQIVNIKHFLTLWLVLTLIIPHVDIKYIDFFLFPEWSSYFIAGACFYMIYKEGLCAQKILLIAGTYLLAIYNEIAHHSAMNEHYNIVLNHFVVVFIISLFYIILMMISLKKTKFLNKQKFIVLGVLTYPLYLIHQNIGFMLFNLLNEYMNKYVILAAVTTSTMFTAYLIHIYIEKKYSRVFNKILTASYNKILNRVKN